MNVWRVVVFAGALLAGARLGSDAELQGSDPGRAQSWKQPAIASFDEAWKTINDTFYDPTFGGIDWAAVRTELRPRVEAAASLDAARAVIREMLGRLKRSHFGLLSSSSAEALPGPASVPIEFRIAPIGVVITSVAAGAMGTGLSAGQVLISIDDQPVTELVRNAEGLDARSAGLEAWRRVNRVLHGGDGSTSTLVVEDIAGARRAIAVRREMPEGEAVPIGNLPPFMVRFESKEMTTATGRRAGLIRFNVWLATLNQRIENAVDAFRKHDAIVIDLRGNPGGLAGMMGGVAGHFIGEPVLLGTMRTRYTPKPLVFNVNPRLATADGRRVEVFKGPLAILVDELTGSTSETFVGSIQGLGRARVFGRQTMGQALPAMTKQLPMGDILIHAIGDFTTAGGKSLEGAGVVPDVHVPISTRALAAGQDEVLEAALRWVDAGAKRP